MNPGMTEDPLRRRISMAATRHFAAQGFHGTSMRDIATAAGCSIAALYHHFQDKEELFGHCALMQYLDRKSGLVDGSPMVMPLSQWYVTFLYRRINRCVASPDIPLLTFRTWLANDSAHAATTGLRRAEQDCQMLHNELFKRRFGAHAAPHANVLWRMSEQMLLHAALDKHPPSQKDVSHEILSWLTYLQRRNQHGTTHQDPATTLRDESD